MPYLVTHRDLAPAVTAPIPPDPSLPQACIIGAGSSGIAAAKALAAAGVPFDWFEQGPVVGGNWVYDNPNGQSACYETLEINTSGPRMAFSDFPMPADYPPYARHDQVAAYFEAYIDHFALRDRITFNTKVTRVERTPVGVEGPRWRVTIEGSGRSETRGYDAVLVANGHHWDARWPEPPYPGTFDGEQLHAHDFRSAEQLRDRDVVVVGSGNSALDISVAAAGAARTTTLSQRRGQWVLRKFLLGRPSDQVVLPGWMPWWATGLRLRLGALLSGDVSRLGLPKPAHQPGQSHPVQSEQIRAVLRSGAVTPKPGIDRLAGDRVYFVDGTSVPADLIVWATGYRVSFPFLDASLVSARDNELPLWKRTIHPDLPGLFFIGLLQPVGAVMPLAEAQGQWLAELLAGRYVLPPDEEIRRQLTAEHERNRRQFYDSPRHTMEVDFDHYLWDLRRERRRGAARARQTASRMPLGSLRGSATS
ncbi:flavin-containing monooxygenase, partial [Intrasporangium sp.]|uniref:flavin-containing monooxygenase n=1 Tax=Intrasporangium sp. TaxID=1925024 RepID=UPI002939E90F